MSMNPEYIIESDESDESKDSFEKQAIYHKDEVNKTADLEKDLPHCRHAVCLSTNATITHFG